MKFDIVRIDRRKAASNTVHLLFDPVRGSLEHGNSGKDEECLVRIIDGARIIRVQEMQFVDSIANGRPQAAIEILGGRVDQTPNAPEYAGTPGLKKD